MTQNNEAAKVDIFSVTAAWAHARGLKLWQSLETTSTNTIAKNDEAPETKPILNSEGAIPSPRASAPSLYLTKRQSGGRGRGTHSWSTPSESSLLSSWSFAVEEVPQPVFSALVGLALYEALLKTWPDVAFNIKAPNDLFIKDKKVAGILIETVDQGVRKTTIVGLGINVSNEPSDLPTATCLAAHLTKPNDHLQWTRFLDFWSAALQRAVLEGQNETLQPHACERLKLALNRHPLLNEPVLRVDELGQLHTASRTIFWHEL